MIIGIVSVIVDNVLFVVVVMGMYSLMIYLFDYFLWEFLVYCVGMGGFILIIGLVVGVVVMGLEKIYFFWYVWKISGLVLVGYFVGVGVYFF